MRNIPLKQKDFMQLKYRANYYFKEVVNKSIELFKKSSLEN